MLYVLSRTAICIYTALYNQLNLNLSKKVQVLCWFWCVNLQDILWSRRAFIVCMIYNSIPPDDDDNAKHKDYIKFLWISDNNNGITCTVFKMENARAITWDDDIIFFINLPVKWIKLIVGSCSCFAFVLASFHLVSSVILQKLLWFIKAQKRLFA